MIRATRTVEELSTQSWCMFLRNLRFSCGNSAFYQVGLKSYSTSHGFLWTMIPGGPLCGVKRGATRAVAAPISKRPPPPSQLRCLLCPPSVAAANVMEIGVRTSLHARPPAHQHWGFVVHANLTVATFLGGQPF